MQISKLKTETMSNSTSQTDFKPKGAMAFFVILIVLCLVIWFGVYFLMISRN